MLPVGALRFCHPNSTSSDTPPSIFNNKPTPPPPARTPPPFLPPPDRKQKSKIRPFFGGGRVKKGRFVIFALSMFYSILGFQDAQMLGKTAQKVSLSNPFSCAPSASKNWDLRAVSPNASRQSTGKMTNRPLFAHIRGRPLFWCAPPKQFQPRHESLIMSKGEGKSLRNPTQSFAIPAAIYRSLKVPPGVLFEQF